MSFRKFIRTKLRENKRFMAVRSEQQMNLPITTPMAYVVSMMTSQGMRISALRWLMTDGLMEAAQGRDELLKKVLANMPMAGRDTIPLGTKSPVRPQANVAGAGNVNLDLNFEAQEIDYGSIPQGPDEITAGALFSPEGRSIFPALNEIEIDGMSIDEYYAENYEPKKMKIIVAGKHYNISLDEIRNNLKEKGLPAFTYGGMNGYLQSVEKGSHKPPHDQRSQSDPLKHHGPSLSNPRAGNINGEPVAEFDGGARGYNAQKYGDTLASMKDKFNSAYQNLQKGQESGLPPEEGDALMSLGDDIKRLETAAEGGKKGGHRTLGVPGNRDAKQIAKGEEYSQGGFTPSQENMPILKDLIQKGVQGEFVVGGQSIRLDPEQQQALLGKILKFSDQGVLDVRGKWGAILGADFPQKNTPWKLSVIVDNGINATEGLKGKLSHVFHQFKGVDAKTFSKRAETKFIPFDVTNMGEFEDNGYKFHKSPNVSKEDMLGVPDKTKFWGYMTLGPDKYRVVQYNSGGEGKMAVEVPINIEKTGSPKGKEGAVLHAGGIQSQGSPKLGHLQTSPAPNKKEFDRLIQLLQQGKLGEPGGPYNNEMELPSVKQGVIQGKKFAMNKAPEALVKELEPEMYNWAYEALWSFAGDPAFQFGYVSDDEIKANLKIGDEVDKETSPKFKVMLKSGTSQEEIVVDAASKEEVETQIQQKYGDDVKILKMTKISGRGIQALLYQRGLEGEEERESEISRVEELIKNIHQGIVPQSTDPEGENYISPKAMEAFGENAFEARKRYIGQYVKSKIVKTHRENEKVREKSGGGIQGDDGKEVGYEDMGSQVRGDTGGFSGGETNRLSRDQLWQKFGVDPNTIDSRTKDDYDTGGAKQNLQPQAQTQSWDDSAFGDADDEASQWLKQNQQQPQQPQKPQQPQQPQKPNYRLDLFDESWNRNIFDKFQTFDQWKETSVVYDPKVPVEDGCGFNVWGAAPTSDPLGISIKGDADTSKSDPTGKGKNVRRRKKK